MKKREEKLSGFTAPLIISIVLHVVLIGVLIWGGQFYQEKPHPVGNMVQAVVIDPALVHQQAQQIKATREAAARKEQERLDRLRRESERLEQSRRDEEERIRQLKEQQARDAKAAREAEQQRKKKEQERIAEEQRAAKAEAARKAKEAAIAKAEQERVAREKAAKLAAEKARKEREAAQKAEQERLAKEKAAKQAAEKARKEKARLEKLEKERKQQEAALNDIFSGLQTEEQQNSSARSQYIESEANRYGQIYRQLIEQNLRLEDTFKGKNCRVNLHFIPTGSGAIVGSLKVLSGDSAVCAATQRAVAQVPSFPLPKDDPDVVNRLKNINLTVKPNI
ncbi:cell envelope integrity protein TolA [Vibrio mangrovi]|uniref:Cell envelope integrity inner membrane protein TolA n=1 Tax=Vibrio mangrovi TaxID=474394 RepID=A0A1Y6ISK2_9VIBR|nr:cell envelope integrity protein TolA [Vibrio mangrovi]MDW6003725.1 cell envelope integrity protein TolA [Vibrio mangrovi]SMR99482.1 cell envelope integrity inner membrane protein TolA [Vibrio mangrovi]